LASSCHAACPKRITASSIFLHEVTQMAPAPVRDAETTHALRAAFRGLWDGFEV
jgi:hypothetical protein